MPTIRTVGAEARARLVRKGTGRDELAPYRAALANLEGDAHLELAPEDNETMRAMKLRVSRASKQVGKDVKYGETQDGTLLVWLSSPTPVRRRRRRRSQTAADGSSAPQEADVASSGTVLPDDEDQA